MGQNSKCGGRLGLLGNTDLILARPDCAAGIPGPDLIESCKHHGYVPGQPCHCGPARGFTLSDAKEVIYPHPRRTGVLTPITSMWDPTCGVGDETPQGTPRRPSAGASGDVLVPIVRLHRPADSAAGLRGGSQFPRSF